MHKRTTVMGSLIVYRWLHNQVSCDSHLLPNAAMTLLLPYEKSVIVDHTKSLLAGGSPVSPKRGNLIRGVADPPLGCCHDMNINRLHPVPEGVLHHSIHPPPSQIGAQVDFHSKNPKKSPPAYLGGIFSPIKTGFWRLFPWINSF